MTRRSWSQHLPRNTRSFPVNTEALLALTLSVRLSDADCERRLAAELRDTLAWPGADHWAMNFAPSQLGSESTTLEIIVPFGSGNICPATVVFAAHGVGVP